MSRTTLQDSFAIDGELADSNPNLRLASLRLSELARDVESACSEQAAGRIDPETALPEWLLTASSVAERAVQRLATSVQRLADGILISDRAMKVADIDSVVALLRDDMLAVLALRDAVALRAWPADMRGLAQKAEQSIVARLRQFGRVCDTLAKLMRSAHPSNAAEARDLDVVLDLDLGHELRVLASRAKGEVPIWKYC